MGRALEHGSLSTLAAVLMLLEVLRRRALAMAPALVADVEYIVSLLDSELAELRALVGRLDKSRTAR